MGNNTAIFSILCIFSIQREEPCSIRRINGIHAVHRMPGNFSGIMTILRKQVHIPTHPCFTFAVQRFWRYLGACIEPVPVVLHVCMSMLYGYVV